MTEMLRDILARLDRMDQKVNEHFTKLEEKMDHSKEHNHESHESMHLHKSIN